MQISLLWLQQKITYMAELTVCGRDMLAFSITPTKETSTWKVQSWFLIKAVFNSIQGNSLFDFLEENEGFAATLLAQGKEN